MHKYDTQMQENVALRHMHQEVTARLAMHQMLDLLPAQLDQDEMDIDAREEMDGFSLDEEREKSQAAVVLQARFRGRQQRIKMHQSKNAEESQAALKIQARIRGRSVRRKMASDREMQRKLYGSAATHRIAL